MVEVSGKALEIIQKQLSEAAGGPKSIRILLDQGGWQGTHLVMGLDEKRSDDRVFTEQGLTFLIDKKLADVVKSVKIDHVEGTLGSGFTLKSEVHGAEDVPVSCDTICGRC